MFMLKLGNKNYNVTNLHEEIQFGNNQLRFNVRPESEIPIKEFYADVLSNISSLKFTDNESGTVYEFSNYTEFVSCLRSLPNLDIAVTLTDVLEHNRP